MSEASQTLQELIEMLPDDAVSNDVKAKVAKMKGDFAELIKMHRDQQGRLKVAERERARALAAKEAIHEEKEALRSKAEETLAGFKENLEALKNAKREPTGYTIVWSYGQALMARVFHEKAKAMDFYNAIGGVPKVQCDAEIFTYHNMDLSKVDKFLNSEREKLESKMAALGFEPEPEEGVAVPDEVHDTLVEARQYLLHQMQNTENPSAKMLLLLDRLNDMLMDDDELDRLNDMLMDDDEPAIVTTGNDWEDAVAEEMEAIEMVEEPNELLAQMREERRRFELGEDADEFPTENEVQ